MHELAPSDFSRVGFLFQDLPYGQTIPNSVIAGWGKGRVFVDDEAQPTAALVCNNGACTLAGDASQVVFAEAVCRWLLEYHGSDYFILYAFPDQWGSFLDRYLEPPHIRKRRRLDFDFSTPAFALLTNQPHVIPQGYELRRIDESLMEEIRQDVSPYSRSYWRSAADFHRHGIGFCVLYEAEIVGICYTCFTWNGHHDIDIMTSEKHQRKGLRLAVARAFIEHCIRNGLTPDWDCWSKNLASVQLAEKLGFTSRVEVTTFHGIRP
ncbi:GNAT family N-acetyltransferase [Ottowia thiooxydans]|uniref:GNAT family N-acetyltransferase n=1 Tax=Ottowia thiooxydans TaxID=219182 RepID=UPI001469D2C7|nr:GNAT family N-acetyltransferase [Ottowia thiooxydans]